LCRYFDISKTHTADINLGEAIINTNLNAHLHLARYCLGEINKQPGGAVIKIGAVNHPYSGVNTYLTAKRGAEGLAEALFEDVREFGTKICTIKPGYANTPLAQSVDLDSRLMIQPVDIAQTIIHVISTSATVCPTEIVLLLQRSPYL
jgi:NADP-dependent 3-hydroxy acid dehydrogenase YdfG